MAVLGCNLSIFKERLSFERAPQWQLQFQSQRRIFNPAEHVWWSFLQKQKHYINAMNVFKVKQRHQNNVNGDDDDDDNDYNDDDVFGK